MLTYPDQQNIRSPFETVKVKNLKNEVKEKQHLRFLTFYKSLVLIPTIASILAVDFPVIYPRKFCKTEAYGYSLMDVGCAAVLFAQGVSHSLTKLED